MKSKKIQLTDLPNEIAVPSVKYRLVPKIIKDVRFTGLCTPIPTVLIEYLDNSELKLFCVLLRMQREKGTCLAKLNELGEAVGLTHVSVSKILTRLCDMNLITQELGYGRKRNKVINFKSLQSLADYLAEMKEGAGCALRKKMKNKNVMNIPPSVQEWMKLNYVLSKDEVENEEF